MQAMPDTKAAQAGLSYLRKHQRADGGFALGGCGGVNAQSTAWAVQGMIAVGADPAKVAAGGNSALDYLAARQAGDGHYRYSDSSDQTPVWVTGEVLVAVAGDALPIAPPPREKKPTTVSPSKTAPPPPGIGAAPPAPANRCRIGAGGVEAGGTGVPPAARRARRRRRPAAIPAAAIGPAVPPKGEAEAAPPNRAAPAAEPVTASRRHPARRGSRSASASPPTALAIGLPWWLGRRFAW